MSTNTSPIFFRQKVFQARKPLEGTHRLLSPEKTWENVSPFAKEAGITRVANITGLDHLQIPVTAAIRPRALTISVSSGKGLSLISAQVSALMEAIELHCAEVYHPIILHLSYDQLCQEVSTIPFSLLPLRKHSLFQKEWPERWILGWDLFHQHEVAAPLASVILNYATRLKEPFELNSFQMSSNGLSSGNHFLEALLSAIYEVIERDAVSCHLQASATTSFISPKVKLETIQDPTVIELIEKLEKADIQLLLYDCTVDTEVPTFMALIYDRLYRHSGIAKGYGTHLDPSLAMIRAITEAVQGRTLTIAGARDDIFHSLFQLIRKFDSKQDVETLDLLPSTIDASLFRSQTTFTLEGDIHLLMNKLKKAGIEQLLVFDLTPAHFPLSVVRVVIPGMEGYYSSLYQPNRRAKKFAEEKKNHKKEGNIQQGIHLPAGATT